MDEVRVTRAQRRNMLASGVMAGEAMLDRRTQQVMMALSVMLGIMIVLSVGAIVLSRMGSGAAQVGVGLAILLSAFLVGALVGFLFSLPRVLARGNAEAAISADQAGRTPVAANEGQGRNLLQTNSNLERVSDWLTTLLIGIALADISKIDSGLFRFRTFIAETSGPCGATCSILPALAPMLLIIGAVLGFLSMYLYTRIEIARLFRNVEDEQNELGRGEQRAVTGQQLAVAGAANATTNDATPPSVQQAVARLSQAPASSSGAISVDDALDTMMALLYLDGGAERVLALARALREGPAAKRGDFWFYQAAAWGQEHRAAQERSDEDRQRMAREGAIDAAREAVSIDPAYRTRLRLLTQADGRDNDLASLAGDQDLIALLK
jgi:hypothetical protein